jgi:hypothetical protein
MPMRVYGLKEAYDNYWNAHSSREEQAAYNEIKLFGGKDGYASERRRFLTWCVRKLRQIAYRIERYVDR